MTTVAMGTERLGDILLTEGLITREQLSSALVEARSSGMPLGYVIAKHGFVPDVEITRIVARQLRVPAVDLSRFEVDQRILKLIPAEVAKRHAGVGRVRLVVGRVGEQDVMVLRAEAKDDAGLKARLAETLAAVTKLKGEVEIVAPGSLPNDGKVIADERTYA